MKFLLWVEKHKTILRVNVVLSTFFGGQSGTRGKKKKSRTAKADLKKKVFCLKCTETSF